MEFVRQCARLGGKVCGPGLVARVDRAPVVDLEVDVALPECDLLGLERELCLRSVSNSICEGAAAAPSCPSATYSFMSCTDIPVAARHAISNNWPRLFSS
ncbi:hypothetical protein [Rhodococcus sp. T2V]|uniref:hypothetical protein n=1 Tax=Rhodococcus sp. T2V TaxID=3034164 RepID=UPI0023E21596|nr:hypothetical protein [Rhodococcus sp. T2V]